MYRIWPRINDTNSNQPKTWTFQGSNDDISWNNLDIQSNITNWEQTNSNSVTNLTEMKEFKIINNEFYKYYRIYILESNGNNSYKSIGELQLYHHVPKNVSILIFH